MVGVGDARSRKEKCVLSFWRRVGRFYWDCVNLTSQDAAYTATLFTCRYRNSWWVTFEFLEFVNNHWDSIKNQSFRIFEVTHILNTYGKNKIVNYSDCCEINAIRMSWLTILSFIQAVICKYFARNIAAWPFTHVAQNHPCF